MGDAERENEYGWFLCVVPPSPLEISVSEREMRENLGTSCTELCSCPKLHLQGRLFCHSKGPIILAYFDRSHSLCRREDLKVVLQSC